MPILAALRRWLADYRRRHAAPKARAKPNTFAALFATWNIRHFRADEFLVMGGSHVSRGSRAFGLNAQPPSALWRNMEPTAKVLDELRERLGTPIRTLSAYRSPAYNRAIGGARRSQHLAFRAVDFVADRGSPREWAAELRRLRTEGLFKGGIGTYRTFVHIDTRGTNRDW